MKFLIDVQKPDILAKTETWLHADYQDSLLGLSNYSIFRKDRNSPGGGVLIAIKDIYYSLNVDTSSSEVEMISVDCILTGNQKLRIICMYIRPDYSVSQFATCIQAIQELLQINYPFALLGDFNLHGIDWDHFLIPTGDKYKLCQTFLLDQQPLYQVIRFPTRELIILDLFFASHEQFLVSDAFPPIGKSDHVVITVNLLRSILINSIKRTRTITSVDYKSLNVSLQTIRPPELCDYKADHALELFYCFIKNLIATHSFVSVNRDIQRYQQNM